MLNYTYLSKQIHDTMESNGNKPSFTVNDLLRQIGIDDRDPELRSRCQQYSMLSETLTDCEMTICDRVININMKTCLIHRPHLDTVVDSIDERGRISKLGTGWDNSNCESWFSGKNKSSTSVQDRRITSAWEAQESLLILKTLHTVTLDYDSEDQGRGYTITCQVNNILKKNPDLQEGPFKKFFKKPTFECSNSIITSLPFSFVQKLSVGKPVHLPKEWKAAIKKDTQLSTSIMTNIQLWRNTRRLFDGHDKWTIRRVYRVLYKSINRNQKSVTTEYVTKRVALMYLPTSV